jgi:hypothetical protein
MFGVLKLKRLGGLEGGGGVAEIILKAGQKMKMRSANFRNRNHISQQKYPADGGMF